MCTPPGPWTIPCPICGRMNESRVMLRHLRDVHPEVDSTIYRRRAETDRMREKRLQTDEKVTFPTASRHNIAITYQIKPEVF